MEGLDQSAVPYQLQQYDNNNNKRESGDNNNVRNSDNVEGFCLKRVYGTEHPKYQHFPDWFTSNIMTLHPPYHRMIHNKPEMLSKMDDDLWNNFRDSLTKAIHSKRRDGFLIAIGTIASFLCLYWPEGIMDQLLKENNKYIRTFIHVFIVMFVGSVWLYLWLVVSDRVKQTIREFNVHSLEINVKVKLERYYRVTESSSGSGLDESVYILFIKQQQNLSECKTTVEREPSDIESSRNATWYEMERYVLRLT